MSEDEEDGGGGLRREGCRLMGIEECDGGSKHVYSHF
jgi:hypothetical protein